VLSGKVFGLRKYSDFSGPEDADVRKKKGFNISQYSKPLSKPEQY